MAIWRRAGSRLALVAALLLASSAVAGPISIVVDTTSFAGTAVDLAFDLTASTENTVTLDPISSDISEFDSITISGNASGSLPNPPKVTLGGSPSTFFNEYLQTVTLGSFLAFTFETSAQVASGSPPTPDTFAFFIYESGLFIPIVDTGGPGGALLTFDFGIEVPVLTLFSSDTLPVRESIVTNVVEPGALALVIAALLALTAMLPVAQTQSRK
jgi:hypothetical protein